MARLLTLIHPWMTVRTSCAVSLESDGRIARNAWSGAYGNLLDPGNRCLRTIREYAYGMQSYNPDMFWQSDRLIGSPPSTTGCRAREVRCAGRRSRTSGSRGGAVRRARLQASESPGPCGPGLGLRVGGMRRARKAVADRQGAEGGPLGRCGPPGGCGPTGGYFA